MEAGGKDCEEETLQTAFKKLRVDVESLSGAVSICDALTSRGASRAPVDGISGAKPKLGSPKDTWHCCTRKTSRGTSSRSQRRRRSKSPILQPPRFTYCSSAAVAPPGGCLKQQRLAEPLPAPDEAAGSVSAERRLPGVPGRGSPVLFGVSPSYEPVVGGAASLTSLAEPTSATPPRWAAVGSGSGSGEEKGRLEGAGAPAPLGSDAADFRALSQLHSRRSADAPCFCSRSAASDCTGGGDPGCCCRAGGPGWNGVEVYSFTGVRECIHEEESRTLSAAPSSSPRSCSEQARVYVDDITIEDLSGYMEYYLYIPKKMSHMAEMMYT